MLLLGMFLEEALVGFEPTIFLFRGRHDDCRAKQSQTCHYFRRLGKKFNFRALQFREQKVVQFSSVNAHSILGNKLFVALMRFLIKTTSKHAIGR